MKKIVTLLIIILALSVIAVIGLHVYVNVYGKNIVASAIKDNLGVEAKIEELSLKFPFRLQIKSLAFGDISVKGIKASLLGFNPFTLQLILNEVLVDGLQVRLKRDKKGLTLNPFMEEEVEARPQVVEEKEEVKKPAGIKKLPFSVRVIRLELDNILVEFTDLVQEEPTKIKAYDATVRIRDLVYPWLTKFYINFDASLETEYATMKNAITSDGWVDYSHKNMDLDINAGHISYWAFSDYYPPFWKPDSLGIRKALLSLESNFNAQDNDLTIHFVLSVDEIKYRKEEDLEDPSRMKTIQTVLAFFKGDRQKPIISVTLETKMHPFKLEFAFLQKTLEEQTRGIRFDYIGEVIKKVKEGAKGSKKIIEAPVEGFKSVVDTITGIFGIITGSQEEEQKESPQN